MKMKDLKKYNDQRVDVIGRYSGEEGKLVIKNGEAHLLIEKGEKVGPGNRLTIENIERIEPMDNYNCPDGYEYVKSHYSNGHKVKGFCRKKVK